MFPFFRLVWKFAACVWACVTCWLPTAAQELASAARTPVGGIELSGDELAVLEPWKLPPAVVAEFATFCPDDRAQQALERMIARGSDSAAALVAAESAWKAAARDSACGSSRSVDYYYQAAAFAWTALRWEHAFAQGTAECSCRSVAWKLYHRSVRRLLAAASRYGRLELPTSLVVNTPTGAVTIPVVRRGFPWIETDFDKLTFVGSSTASELRCRHAWGGLGVPSVVLRRREECCDGRDRYFAACHPFAATWVLVPDLRPWLGRNEVEFDSAMGTLADEPARLECCDPLRIRAIEVAGASIKIAGDISAPMAWFAANTDGNRQALEGLLRPGSATFNWGMYMLEPYQPGKIPIVFVHGLAGNPNNWLDLANDLRADPWVASRYQLWAFSYPTGAGFLKSAADLRRDLQIAAANCDPCLSDQALHQMVMIGHSMGGLLTKLQVTHGGARLWDAFFRVPCADVRIPPARRREVMQRIYFAPNPLVTRAVFVATPHDGAPAGRGAAQCLSRWLIKSPEKELAMFEQFRQENPGVLRWWVRRRLPTSVDMLALANPLVRAMRATPVAENVRLNTIYGKVPNLLTLRRSDRVVPVASARHPGVESECMVRSGHSGVHTVPDTAREIRRILRVHVRQGI
jgi:pimeloyl-ACP methyl ester carboxylesterase